MITYKESIIDINPEMLNGFFNGWKDFPSPHKLYEILRNSEYIIVAFDDESNKAIGFINAISDRVLSAYIPLLEVLPQYQNRGIGSQLVKRMMSKLEDYYMIDIVCDESHQGYYEKFGFHKYTSMIRRNYSKLSESGGIKK